MELKNMPLEGIVFGLMGFIFIILALAIFSKDTVMGLGLTAIGYTLLVGSITFFSHNSLKEKIDKILNHLEKKRRK